MAFFDLQHHYGKLILQLRNNTLSLLLGFFCFFFLQFQFFPFFLNSDRIVRISKFGPILRERELIYCSMLKSNFSLQETNTSITYDYA